ncbi:MAG TPA: AsmA-like C-terminal region-containing protein, partial [Longimicrobiales bacterium]
GGVAYTDVRASVVSRPDRLHIEQATFGMMGGRGDVTAVLTPRADGMHALVQADMIDLSSDQFLTRFTSFRERANGRLDLTGVVELMMDGNMLPARETLEGRGVMTLRDGRLAGWPVLRTLGERLGTPAFDTLRLREFTGGFDVAGPMVRLDDALLASSAGNARVAGSFTFDGTVDLGVDARLPASLATRGGSMLAGAIGAVADTTGEVPVGVRVAGAWRSPSVTPDLSQARANVVGAARDAAAREAERIAAEGARTLAERLGMGQDSAAADSGAAPRLPSVDSIGAAVDSARDAMERRARDRLRSLF